MPTAQLPGGPAFDLPPRTLRRVSEDLYEYLFLLHTRLFGAGGLGGDLDDTNIGGLAHTKTTGVSAYQHHGSDAHGDMVRASAVTNAPAVPAATSTAPASISLIIASADADATYDANEQALLNELKADVNTLITATNNLQTSVILIRTDVATTITAVSGAITQLNALLSALRTAKVVAS